LKEEEGKKKKKKKTKEKKRKEKDFVPPPAFQICTNTDMGSLKELTEDEAALYDRQIRLWGLDAQQRFFCPFFLVPFLFPFLSFSKPNASL